MQDLLGVFADTIRIATFQDTHLRGSIPGRVRRPPLPVAPKRLRVG